MEKRTPGAHLHPMLRTRYVGVAAVSETVGTPVLEKVLAALKASCNPKDETALDFCAAARPRSRVEEVS